MNERLKEIDVECKNLSKRSINFIMYKICAISIFVLMILFYSLLNLGDYCLVVLLGVWCTVNLLLSLIILMNNRIVLRKINKLKCERNNLIGLISICI